MGLQCGKVSQAGLVCFQLHELEYWDGLICRVKGVVAKLKILPISSFGVTVIELSCPCTQLCAPVSSMSCAVKGRTRTTTFMDSSRGCSIFTIQNRNGHAVVLLARKNGFWREMD